jgi:hypothetical protein
LLEDLDGTGDCRQRRPQFVGRIRHEVAFGSFAALTTRDVGDDDHCGVGGGTGREQRDDVGVLVVGMCPHRPRLRVLREDLLHCDAQRVCRPGIGEGIARGEIGADELPCARVRELDRQGAVDSDHAFLELFEKAIEAMPLALQPLERRAQGPAHAIDGAGKCAELVRKARR